jgi:hypothetical protein
MSVEGFASLREFIRRAVRQINGVPNDVLSTLENQIRLHHELLLDACDETRSRGAAVIHATDRECERARQLVNEILHAEGAEAVTLRRAQDPGSGITRSHVSGRRDHRGRWPERVRPPGHTEIVWEGDSDG